MGNVAAISVPIQNWRACNTPVRWCTAPHPPPQGVLAQLRREQGGKVRSSTVLAPADSFGRVMRLLRYLCENGVGPEQWLEVLEDVHQPYQLLDTSEKRNKYSRRTGFLWHLSVLRAQTSAILRN